MLGRAFLVLKMVVAAGVCVGLLALAVQDLLQPERIPTGPYVPEPIHIHQIVMPRLPSSVSPSSASASASSSAVANEQGDVACSVDGLKVGECQAPEEWDSGSEPYVWCEARTRAAVLPGTTPCRSY